MWQLSYILISMVAKFIYSDRLNATQVKCHLMAFNPGGNYQGNRWAGARGWVLGALLWVLG